MTDPVENQIDSAEEVVALQCGRRDLNRRVGGDRIPIATCRFGQAHLDVAASADRDPAAAEFHNDAAIGRCHGLFGQPAVVEPERCGQARQPFGVDVDRHQLTDERLGR